MSESVLQPATLQLAYSQGYFPMPDPHTGEILWFSPDPRAIFPLDGFHCSRSLRRRLRQRDFAVTYDQDFLGVIGACANRPETWITEEFIAAYTRMHQLDMAHSVEVWRDKELVGGVYGVHLAGAFFAESMFHTATDASKVALYYLVERLRRHHFQLLEVQFMTPHLASLGAVAVSAQDYRGLLRRAMSINCPF